MSNPGSPSPRHRTMVLLVTAVLVAACGEGADLGVPGQATSSCTSAATTTRSCTPTPIRTSIQPTGALQDLLDEGYELSDEWVVETIVRDVDSATGGLVAAEDGSFLQADFGFAGHPGDTVHRITADGEVLPLARSEEFADLTMLVRGPDGRLYLSSYGTDTVFVLDLDGSIEVLAEGISGPAGLAVLDDGTVFVEAYDGNTIHRISPDGSVEGFARHPGFRGVNGLTQAPDGTLYAVNHRNGGLFAIGPDGTVTPLHEFPGATSHVVWHDDGLFVTSREDYVVYRYDVATGEVAIIAGNGEPGDVDGRGGAASFGRPNAITLGPDGALYTNHGDGDTNSPVSIRRLTHRP